jgi:UDP-glucose 4-epimerase
MAEFDRVLVTGGSGYIASFCIAQLLLEGASAARQSG